MNGVQHNGLVIGLDGRLDNTHDAVKQCVRRTDSIKNVVTASWLSDELRQAGALHNSTVQQLIEIAGEHNGRRRVTTCKLGHIVHST